MVSMRKAAWVCIMCMLIFLSMLSIISNSTYADLLTTVTANINEDEQAVDVSPGSQGSIVYTGIVEVENYNTATPLIVTLFAESSVGTATIDKPSMVFQGNKQTDSFQLVLTIPLGSSASEDHSCTITGTWEQGGRTGEVEGDTSKIIILPFYLPVISCDSPNRNITKGNNVIFDMKLNNSGNTDDVIRVEIENIEELKDRGIEVGEISDMSIAEGGSKEFKLRVKTSDDTPIINSIEVIATSIVDEELTTDILILTVFAREKDLIEVLFNPLVFIIIAVVITVGIVVYVKKR